MQNSKLPIRIVALLFVIFMIVFMIMSFQFERLVYVIPICGYMVINCLIVNGDLDVLPHDRFLSDLGYDG